MTRHTTTTNMKNWPSIVQVVVVLTGLLVSGCIGYGICLSTISQQGKAIEQQKIEFKEHVASNENDRVSIQKKLTEIVAQLADANTQQAVANTKLDSLSKQFENFMRILENRKLDKVATSDMVSVQQRN